MTIHGAASVGAKAALTGLVLLLLARAPAAGELRIGGYLGTELRIFPQSAEFEDQHDSTLSPSVLVEPEFTFIPDEGRDRFVFVPFGRIDAHDQHRTHADIREAKWLRVGDGWDFVVGVDRVFWGVTESRHLVNIVNQIDQVEDIDQEDWLGQPMLNFNLLRSWGTLRFYVLPFFRERTFPDAQARLRGPLPIKTGQADYAHRAEDHHVDLAVRYSHTIGGLDLGLAHFHGTGREPRLVPRLRGGRLVLVPFYEIIDQTSLDAQYTTGPWAWKLEALTRDGQGGRFQAAVAGLEYTFFDVRGSGVDVGLLAEYLYDGRDEDEALPTALDDDIFLGARFTFNDLADSHLLAGIIIDRGDGGSAFSVEASTRLTDRLRLELDARGFFNVSPGDTLNGFDRDDFVLVRLSWYF